MLKKSVLILFLKINLMLCVFSQSIRYNKIFVIDTLEYQTEILYNSKYINDSIILLKIGTVDKISLIPNLTLCLYNARSKKNIKHETYKIGTGYFSARNDKILTIENNHFSLNNTSIVDSNISHQPILTCIDSSLNIQFLKKIYVSINSQGFQLFSFDYLNEYFYYTGYLHTLSQNRMRSIILKTDIMGNVIWSKLFIHLPYIYQQFSGLTQGWDILADRIENKLYVVTNGVINKGWGGPNLQDCEGWNRNVTHITLIDTAGNVLYDYEDPESSRFTSKILQDSQGNLVYSGGVGLPELQKPPWCLPDYLPSITKLSPDFNKMWDYVCVNAQPVSDGPTLHNFYTSLKILENDDVLASGYIIRPHFSQSIKFASFRVSVITRLNTVGELKWERYYAYLDDSVNYSRNKIFTLEVLSNGDIIAGGEVVGNVDDSPNYQNSWIMRLDSMGCLIPGCHITSVEPEKEPEELDWEIKEQLLIYPNPATDVVYLMLQNYEEAEYILQITDMNGRIVQSQTQIFSDTQYILDVSNWKQGMYFAALFKNGEKKEVKKIVKQ